jgi:hypothetical protein
VTYVIRVAMLLIADITLMTMAHDRSEPWMTAGWWMIGPSPPALTTHHTKKVIPAVGATNALSVKRWRLGSSQQGLPRKTRVTKLTFCGSVPR